MTQRDLDEAVARLRAAASRQDPTSADLSTDFGPPRGRPESVGQGPLDPDIVDAHAHLVTGHEAPAPAGSPYPRTDFRQPLPTDAVVRTHATPASPAVPPPPTVSARPASAPAASRPAPPQPPARPVPPQQRAAPRSADPHGAEARAAEPAPPRIDPQDRFGQRRGPSPATPQQEADRLDPALFEEARRPAAKPLLPSFLRRTIAAPAAAPPGETADTLGGEAPAPAQREPEQRVPEQRERKRRRRSDEVRGGKRRTRDPRAPLTPKEQRWQRRRRRYLFEEVLGWILVPVIVVGLYFVVVWGLSLFNLTIDDILAGAQQAWDAFQAR